MTGFVDFHTHSNLSDGTHSPEQLICHAIQAGITTLAITDHNTPLPNLPELQASYPAIHLVPGCEISCLSPINDQLKELHIVALGCDFSHPAMVSVLRKNTQFNRAIYINKILSRLADCNIYIGSYESLKERYPDTLHLGRKHIAAEMVRYGYVKTIDEAFDIYIGAFGQRLAYVKNTADYASLEETVNAILLSGGIAILAHLFYYQLPSESIYALLKYFKNLTGNRGGLEVFYAGYSDTQTAELQKLSLLFDFIRSAASDYHGTEHETLAHHYPSSIFEPMKPLLFSEQHSIQQLNR